MKSLSDMVEEVSAYLRSFIRDQELSTHLEQNIEFGTFSLKVADPTLVSRGRIQIGDELIWVDSADRVSGTLSIPPYGRGMDGTNPEAHEAGTRVIMAPLYPRQLIKSAINQSITSVGSQLYGVETLSIEPSASSYIYPLPAYARDVLSVRVADSWGVGGGDVGWLRDWQFDKNAPSTAAESGKALYLNDGRISPRQELSVVVSRDPAVLYFGTQMFSECFLPQTAWDVVVLLTASRLLATAEAAELSTRTIEANQLDAKSQGQTTAQRQSNYLFSLYQQRLADERMRLLNSTVQRVHYSR
jgi:hypothetical protein